MLITRLLSPHHGNITRLQTARTHRAVPQGLINIVSDGSHLIYNKRYVLKSYNNEIVVCIIMSQCLFMAGFSSVEIFLFCK